MPTYTVTLTETVVYTVDVEADSIDDAAALALDGMQTVEGFNGFDADSAGDLRVEDVEESRFQQEATNT